MSGEILFGGILVRGDFDWGDFDWGILSRRDFGWGDFVRGDFGWGDIVRGDFVRGDFVLEPICTLPKVEHSFSQMNSIMPATTNKMETKTLVLRLCKLSYTANYQILPQGNKKN